MALNFGKWREKNGGAPLAQVAVYHYVGLEELTVAAVFAAQAEGEWMDDDDRERALVGIAGLTRGRLETAVRDRLQAYGTNGMECAYDHVLDEMVEACRARARALFPEIVRHAASRP